MVTSILVRPTHEAVVTIGYDELNIWIDYKESKNLNYNPKDLMGPGRDKRHILTEWPRIHPDYNRWVSELADQIKLRMQDRPKSSDAPPLLIADELDKLDKLRQRGVLTRKELDRQKAKLLAR